MKRVFISHPFSSDPILYKKRADYICKEIMSEDLNILPISPLHSFSFIEKEPPELRPAIMETCFLFIDLCDEVWVYLYPGVVSNGQTLEMYYCIATNKKMVYKIIENEGD